MSFDPQHVYGKRYTKQKRWLKARKVWHAIKRFHIWFWCDHRLALRYLVRVKGSEISLCSRCGRYLFTDDVDGAVRKEVDGV